MTNLKRMFVGVAVLAVMLSAVLVIPSGATYVSGSFDKPCSCGEYFYGEHYGGITDGAGGEVFTHVSATHRCDGLQAYVSVKCWVYTSNYNNYTSRTFTRTENGTNSVAFDYYVNNQISDYNLRAVEINYQLRVRCEGDEFYCRAYRSEGNIPLSIQPPTVTE